MRKVKNRIRTVLTTLINKGAFSIVAGNFATKFVSFFGSIFLVRVLTKSDFGILTYAENIMGYFILASGGGLSTGLSRHLLLLDATAEKYACYRYAVKRGTAINALLIVIGVAFCLLYPHPDQYMAYKWVPICLTLVIPFFFIQNCGLSTIRCMFDNHIYAICSFAFSVLIIASRVAGGAAGGLAGTVIGRIIANLLAAGICFYVVWRRYFREISADGLFDEKRTMNRYSVQIMLTDGLWHIFALNDIFLLGRFSSELVLADYKIASVIPGNLAILVAAIGTFTAPYFTLHGKQDDKRWIWSSYKKTILLSASIMGGASLMCAILAKPLIVLLYGEQYVSAVPIMRVLLLAIFFNCGLRSMTANALSAMGEQKYNMYLAGVCAVIQVVMNVALIPKYGSMATAWISVLLYFLMSLALCGVFIKKYRASTAKGGQHGN